MRVGDLGEFGLIDLLVKMIGTRNDVIVGPGDDAAVVQTYDGSKLFVTTDTFAEDIHFDRTQFPASDVGWKALAVSLSDVAAMGGAPSWATINIRVPHDLEVKWCLSMYTGLQMCAEMHEVAIVGGNVSRSIDGRISIDISVIGVADRGRYIRRAGARPGDAVLVTGPTGLAAAGRGCLDRDLTAEPYAITLITSFLRPDPQIETGRIAARNRSVTAMIDISDGLAADLGHICDSSGVGAEIYSNVMPHTRDLIAYCDAGGGDPLVHALTGGEDYELIICCRPEHAAEFAHRIRAAGIGTITEGEEVVVLDIEDRPVNIDVHGWNHLHSS